MYKIIILVISTIICSFYYFPFELVYFPGINTKMVMAAISLILLPIKLGKRGDANIELDFLWISIGASLISLIAYFSIIYNNTIDTSYVGYIVSMWVWLGGAYTLILILKKIYGYLSIELIVSTLVNVCILQCVLAIIINSYPTFESIVDNFLGGEAAMGVAEGRIYGIGAALDVAGLRFSAVLVMVAFLVLHSAEYQKNIVWYVAAFLIISVVGNMIARTTTMGLVLAILYWVYSSICEKNNYGAILLWKRMILLLIIALPLIVIFYNYNQLFHDNIRFAFEGFFSLWEKGKWEVSSNDILLNHMIVFPDNLRTWIIGDGYMADPSEYDINYIGRIYHGYYMGTDIGYLRFIFYFGMIGLLAFMSFMWLSYKISSRKFESYKQMFFLVLLVNYAVWFKVSTDIFVVFAIFLVLDRQKGITKQIIS